MSDISSRENENSNIVKYWRKEPKSIEKFQFVYHFLPKEEKKRRADLLDNKAILIYCIIIFFVTAAFRFIPKVAPGVLGYASDINISDLLKYTNKKRQENGASNLTLNSKLSAAAEKKARDMFEDGYWAHVAPDGTEPWDFIIGENYEYIYAGENLAKNFSTSREVVEAWFKSPSHKSNLIGTNYDEVGFAVVNGVMDGYETTLVVQMFGRPRQPSMVAAVYEENTIPQQPQVSIEKVSAEVIPTQEEIVLEDFDVTEETEEMIQFSVPVNTEPFVDVTTATKSISLAFGGFVGSLLGIDVWYSRKKGIRKLTGQTLAHIMILFVVVASIWFVFRPGIVI
ncbi:CAP domain-containing protein [Patescibacteria group bacterium]|nr:CAP domain-containing protein [Patescibacteria group bacterium]